MEIIAGVTYSKPQVILLQETGIGTAEYAARTCYDSFESSENKYIQSLHKQLELGNISVDGEIHQVNNLPHSNLLDDLAWTYFHHSILEHANLTYLIRGTSRGVLQEHARHRIQSISVRSTRYTLSPVINAFVAEILTNVSNTYPSDWFISTLIAQDLFVTQDYAYNALQTIDLYHRLKWQFNKLGKDEFMHLAVAKSSLSITEEPNGLPQAIYEYLQAGKRKRNVGDSFKHIINDTWKVDMVVTMNLRALKNYLTLRDSGAAYFGIRHLAEAMKQVTPSKYLDLIIKGNTNVKPD
jgi:thymidylate synthase (FAD)